jgi:hypothetical protein
VKPRDPIIDLSSEQKEIRIKKLAAELNGFGYSVVSTAWLRRIVTVKPDKTLEIAR